MTNGGRIDYTIGFKTDKTGLKEAEASLQKLKNSFTADDLYKLDPKKYGHSLENAEKQLIKIKEDITQIQTAFRGAFNTTTGQMNLTKLQESLKKLNLNNIYNSFSQLGKKGEQAFYQMTKAALTTNTQFIKTKGILDKMGESLLKTAGWSISSSAINRFAGNIQQAWGYVQHLDTSLNNIRIVTGKSADEMERFAEKANKSAQALGKSTTEYTEAALIYYQQGLSDEETAARTETTLKAASVTGQSAKAVSEQLTAVWNGYRVTAEGTEEAVDKLAAVAATTAADLEELSTGMSKVASAANSMGVDMDQLNATIATIESVTRQAPESVGTALKTIYARMGDLKLGDTDEDGLKLGDVSSTLKKVGIDILDVNGELRDMGIIIEEIGEKWNMWTKAQQTAIAESVAGKRQYNNLFALFDNWDMYTEALETSRNATGTLQKQQDVYMESTAAHIQKLKTEWEDLYDSLLNEQSINKIIDSLTKVLSLFTNFVDSIGGGGNAFLLLGSTAVKVFQKQIGKEIGNFVINMQQAKDKAQQLTAQMQIIEQFKQSKGMENSGVQALVGAYDEIKQYYEILDQQGLEQANILAEQVAEAAMLKEEFEEAAKAANKYIEVNNKLDNPYDIINEPTEKNQKAFSESLEMDTTSLVEADKQLKALKADFLTIQNITEEETDDLDLLVTGINNNLDHTSEEWKRLTENVGQDTIDNFSYVQTLIDEIDSNIHGMSEGFKAANPEFKQMESILNEISTSNTMAGYSAGIQKLIKALEEAGPKGKEFLAALRQTEHDAYATSQALDGAAQALNRFLQNEAIKQFSVNVTNTIGSIGQLASGISALNNLGDIFSNENLSNGEKFLQIITNLGTSLPMIFGNLQNVINGFSQFSTLANKATQAVVNMTKGDAALVAAKKILKKLDEEEIIALYGEKVAREFSNNELKEENALLVINEQVKLKNISVTSLLASTIKTKLLKTLQSFGTWLKTFPGIASSVLVAMGLILKGLKAYKEFTLEEEAQQASSNLQIAQKDLDSITEYTDKVKDLVEVYKDLKEQQANHEISLEALKNHIYDVANEYNIQIDAIKLLTASYEELDEIIRKVHNEALNTQSIAEKDVINRKQDNLIKNAQSSTYKFISFNTPMVEDAKKDGLEDFFEQDIWGYHINWDRFYKASQEEQDKFTEFLEYWRLGLNSTAKEALNYINEHNDELVDLRQSEQNYREGLASNLFESLSADNELLSASDVETLKQNIASQLATQLGITVDEALQLAQDEINKHENLLTINASIDLATELAPQWGEDVNKLADDLSKLSLPDLQLVSQNKEIAGAYDNLDNFLEKFKDARDFLGRQENILAVRVALTNTDGKKFKDDDISTLFNTSTFGEENNITQEQFSRLDYSQQLQLLLDYYIIANQKSNEHKEIAIKNLKEQQAEVEANTKALLELTELYDAKDLEHATGENSYLNTQIERIESATEEFNLAEEDLQNLLVEYSEGKIDNSNEYIKIIQETTGLTDDQIANLGRLLKIQEAYNRATADFNKDGKGYSELLNDLNHNSEDLNNQTKVIENTTADWYGTLELAQKRMEDINKQIDNMQSAYKSLTSVMEEYNETGVLSMDNLQALLEMDTAYLSALEIENGQMTLNEDALKQVALARLDDAEATAYEEAMAELNELAQNGSAAATENVGAVTVATTANVRECVAALQEGAVAWNNWWAAMERGAGIKNEQSQAIGDALKNKLTAIGQVRSQIQSGNISFGTTMKGPDKSKKSGSGSSKDPEQKKHEEHEIDIYRTINKELEQIESTLGRIQKINDHEWGIDAQKTLEEENKLLDQQLEKLEEKRGLQERDLSTRRKQLEDIGVSFTADGSAMTNAEEKLDQLYNQYNSMIDHYNGLSVEGQEAYKAELEAEKDKIDKIEKKMDEYESGFSEYQSTLDKILDTHYEAIANEINQFNNMIDVHLELNDAQKEWDKFWSEVVEDVRDTDFAGQIAASMKQLETLVGTPFKNADSDVAVLTNHLKDTVAEVQAQIASANRGGEDSLFGDDTLASKENLTKYRDALMDALRNAKEEIDNISETYLKMLDDAQDKIDKQVDGWNSIGDQIEHDVELIKLISGDKAYDALAGFYEQQYQNNLKLINTQKQSQDFWKSQIDIYKQLLATTDESSVEWQTYDKALRKSVENYRKATQDLDKTVQESIKDLQTWRENNVNAITDTLDKAMSKGLGLDLVEQEWKLINDYADQYYDNVERALNMQEYTNILDDAANAVGLTAENQEKLNNFRREELAQLNEKEKLTQYDIDESKARLEILKAEIALQDAQRNKSNMRLRRDNQGNYVYQYTGNDQDIENAENGMLTAKREWYELVKKRNKETNDYIIQLSKERIDLQNQLAQAQMDGDVERINLLLDLIKRNEEQQVDAFAWAEDTKQDLIKGTATYFADVENHDVLPMFEATVNHLVDRWAGDDDSFIKASITAVQKLQTTQDEYAARTKVVLTEAGINYQELREEQIDPTIDSLNEMVASNEELADELDNVNDLLREQESNLRDVEYAYYSLRNAAVSAISAAQSALNTLANTAINTVQRVQAAIQAANNAGSIISNMTNNYARNAGSGGSSGAGAKYTSPTSTTTSRYKTSASYQGVGKGSNTIASVNQNANTVLNEVINRATQMGLSAEEIERLKKLTETELRRILANFNTGSFSSGSASFATGGYTGSWGNSGKLAMLHEKELVLNKDDTSNILKAVNAIRQVVQAANTSKISNNLLNSSNISADILSRISAGFLQGTGNVTTSNSNNTSNMIINADFSGVRNADEIYQALLELQNYGLQQNYSVEPNINIDY